MKTRTSIFFGVALCFAMVPPVQAEMMIDPVTVSVLAGSEFNNDPLFFAINTLDGLTNEDDQAIPPAAHQGTHWLATEGIFTETLTYDLGGAYDLTRLNILNTSNTGWNDSETDTFTMALSTDGVTFSHGAAIPLQEFDLGFQSVPATGTGTTHVQLIVTNDPAIGPVAGADVRVGLNEVQFYFDDPGADSDNDGMIDAWEIEHFGDLTRDGTEDEDLPAPDGLTNKQEHDLQTDPLDPDSDDDNLSDGDEVLTHMTNPNNSDSDADGLTDDAEILTHMTDPNDADSDDDDLDDGEEVNTYRTDPNNADTDGDTLSDGVEVNVFMTDPLVFNELGISGEMIDPTTIIVTAGSLFNDDPLFEPANLVDGMINEDDQASPPAAHQGTHWLATEGTFTETVTFDLGGSYELTGLNILNTSNTGWNDSETDSFTIAASSDGGTVYSTPTDPIPLLDFSLGFQPVPFPFAGATHVQLVVTNDDADDQGTNDVRVGLNEVQFFSGPGSPFEITSIIKGEAGTSLTFNSINGASYKVEFSDDLDTWLELDDGILGIGDSTTYIDTDPSIQGRSRVFYRFSRLGN